jgi:hypothetical protein
MQTYTNILMQAPNVFITQISVPKPHDTVKGQYARKAALDGDIAQNKTHGNLEPDHNPRISHMLAL